MKVPSDVVQAITGAKRVLLTSHVPPDGDGLGSGIALVRLLRARGAEAVFATGGPIQTCLEFVCREDEIDTTAEGPNGEFDLAIALDSGSLERLRELGPRCLAVERFLNIDHHATNSRYARVNWVDAGAAATGELVYRLLEELGHEISKDLAEPLYVALVTDTGRFSYSNVTPETHRIAAELLTAGANPVDVTERIYRTQPLPLLKLHAMGVGALEVAAGGLAAHLTVTGDMVSATGADPRDVGDLVDIPISVEGVEVGVLFRDLPDGNGTKVSLRSRRWFSVSDFAATFGGGGHPRASGAVLPMPLSEARDILLAALTQALEEGEE